MTYNVFGGMLNLAGSINVQDFVADSPHADVEDDESDDASQDEDDDDHDVDDSAILPVYRDDSRLVADEPRSEDGSGGDGGDTTAGSDFTFEPLSSAADDDDAADQLK